MDETPRLVEIGACVEVHLNRVAHASDAMRQRPPTNAEPTMIISEAERDPATSSPEKDTVADDTQRMSYATMQELRAAYRPNRGTGVQATR
jgi:hypothetical protein